MASIAVLAALAARLNREATQRLGERPAIPALYFFTDPARTPDPVAIAGRLPRGSAVVFRHFGRTDRFELARALERICRTRGLKLLIAADPLLADRVGADGVHWPEALAPRHRGRFPLEIAAAHSRRAIVRASAAGFDACVLGPVFNSRSPSASRPLGIVQASVMIRNAEIPVIALGGVKTHTARQLIGRGFAGLAAIDALKD